MKREASTPYWAGLAAWTATATAGPARAALLGAPEQGQIGFLPANSPVADDIQWLHNWDPASGDGRHLRCWCWSCSPMSSTASTRTANPVPSRTVHNGPLEIAWTILPVIVLVVIAVPSFRLLTDQLELPEPDLTIKATASQWHWNYTYPKAAGGFSYDSLIKEDKDLKPGDIRLLSVDNAAYVPVGKNVEIDVVSQDVIHSFSVPSFGVKIDAVPGRLNKAWFRAEQEGVFYGQCSNICGIDHAFMPIEFHVVSQKAYEAWLMQAKKTYAAADGVDLAAVAPNPHP